MWRITKGVLAVSATVAATALLFVVKNSLASSGDATSSSDSWDRVDFDTHFIKKYFSNQASLNDNKNEEKVASIFSTWLFNKNKETLKLPNNNNADWDKRKNSAT